MSTNHEHDNLNEVGGAENAEAAVAGAPSDTVSKNEPSSDERRSNDIYELMKSNILTYGPDYAAAVQDHAPHLANAMWGYVTNIDNLDRFHFGEAHSRAVEGMQSQGMRWSEHEGPREMPDVLDAANELGRRLPHNIYDLTMNELMEVAADTPVPYGSVEVRELGHRDSYPPDAKIDHAGRPGDRYDLTSYVGVSGTFVSQQDHSCTIFVNTTPGETLREIEAAQARRDRGEVSRDRHIFNDLVEHSKSLERQGERLSFGERVFRVNEAIADGITRVIETGLRTVLGESGLRKFDELVTDPLGAKLDTLLDRILPTPDQPSEPTKDFNPRSDTGPDLSANAPGAGETIIHTADFVNVRELAESAHNGVDHASAWGIQVNGELDGYTTDISAKDVGRDGFDLIQFKEIPGTFVTQFHDTMHVSGDLPDVIRDIADAQVLRDVGEIDPQRPIFDDLREASLQREEQSRHIKDVTNYLQEIEAADAELTHLRERDLAAGREEAGQAPGSQQTFTLTRDELRKALDSAVFLSLEYRDAEGKIAERSIGEVADRTIERLEASTELSHQEPTLSDQNSRNEFPAPKESFTLSRTEFRKILDTAIDTSHQPGVGKNELIGWIMADQDYRAATPNADLTNAGSAALSKLLDVCEKAITAEQGFDAGAKNPYIEYCERLNWVTPMKETVAKVRQAIEQKLPSATERATQEQGDTCPHGTHWPEEDCGDCTYDYYWKLPTDPDMPDPEFGDVPDEDVPDDGVDVINDTEYDFSDEEYDHKEAAGERTWPNNISQVTIHELTEGAHHQIAPYSSSEVLQIAEKDQVRVDASARGVGHQDDKFDVVTFQKVPGTFVSQGDSTVHVSTGFRETVDGVYQAQDLRASDGKYAEIHVYSDLVEKSEGIDQKTRDRQLTLERSLER